MIPDRSRNDDWRNPKVLSGNLFYLRLRDCREIRRFRSNDPLQRFRIMGLQVLAQELDGAALSRCMADNDD
jgi:hypothetical protein